MAKVFWLSLMFGAVSGFASDLEVISKDKGVLSSQMLTHFKKLFELTSFIETGTYAGDTTFEASNAFSDVHSVEIWEPLHQKAQLRFENTPNIHLYLGDTTRVLGEMILRASPNRLYWLDAHSSGGGTGGEPGFSPIAKELEQIYASGDTDSVILIDDLRGMCHCDNRTNLPLRLIVQKLQETHSGLKFYAMGDIGIAFNANTFPSVTVSKTVKAATMSMFFDPNSEDEGALETLVEAESAIASVRDDSQEGKNFSDLTKWADRTNLGGEVIYLLWGALQNLNKRNYASAIADFQLVANSFYAHWRVDAYLVKALILDGQLERARSLFRSKLEKAYAKHPRVLGKIFDEQEVLELIGPTE